MTFNIEDKRFGDCMSVGDYSICRQDEAEEWKDGNGKTHKHIYRTRVSGSCVVHFRTEAQMKQFQELMLTKRTEGYYIVVCDIVNTGEKAVEIEAYLSAQPTQDNIGSRETFADFELKLEER